MEVVFSEVPAATSSTPLAAGGFSPSSALAERPREKAAKTLTPTAFAIHPRLVPAR
jgi:hypothetical protein